jgi:hypothetical protein
VWSVAELIDFGDANLDRRVPAAADAVAEDLPGPQALGGGFLGAGACALWTILMLEAWRRRWRSDAVRQIVGLTQLIGAGTV